MVDSSAVMKVEGRKRQHRSIAEKRRIVELAMLPGECAKPGSGLLLIRKRRAHLPGAVG